MVYETNKLNTEQITGYYYYHYYYYLESYFRFCISEHFVIISVTSKDTLVLLSRLYSVYSLLLY